MSLDSTMQSDPMDDSLNNSHDCLTLRDLAVFVVNVSGTVEIDPNPDPDLPYLPLITCLNLRSLYKKVDALGKAIKELGFEVILGQESRERHKNPLEQLLSGSGLTVISKARKGKE